MLKYVSFRKDLVELLKGLECDEPLPPVRQLICDYKVSLSTVRRVLDDLERDGKIVRKRGIGIFPLRSGCKKSRFTGLYLPGIDSIYYEHVLMGVAGLLRAESLPLLLFQGEGDGCSIWSELETVSGAVIMPSADNAENIDFIRNVRHIQGQGVKIVILDNPLPGLSTPFVGMNNYGAFSELSERLRAHGCRHIAVVGKSLTPSSTTSCNNSLISRAILITSLNSLGHNILKQIPCQIFM